MDWEPFRMNYGEARNINWSSPPFYRRIRVELYEHDRRKDDYIGALELNATDGWGTEQSHHIEGRRAVYVPIIPAWPGTSTTLVGSCRP